MNSDVETVDLHTDREFVDESTSASLSMTVESRYEPMSTARRIGPAAAAVLAALAANPSALDARLLVVDDGSNSLSNTTIQTKPTIGRRISRAEALQISRSILDRAERERLALADFEAERGIQWG